MNASSQWLDLDQVEARLCIVTAQQLGMGLDEVQPESRMIEDLNCDSLEMIELIMETEDEFGITIPETPKTPVGKLIFTRQPFRIRDLAEFAFLNQGTGAPVRAGWRKKPIGIVPPPESGFTQLGGRFDTTDFDTSCLHEKLDDASEFPMFRRVIDGMVCIQIPGDTFTLGNDAAGAHDDERPCHRATLSPFLIDIEPVSVTAFCRFLNSVDMQEHDIAMMIALSPNDDRETDLQFQRCEQNWKPRPGTAMQPVVLISWYAADAYSRWANGTDCKNRNGAAKNHGRSYLPTEAQWEYAAAGSFDDQEHLYAGIHQRGKTYESDGLPIPVVHQEYGRSRFGLRHMSGTVWHWCRDWFSPDFYSSGAATQLDPVAEVETGTRSERGGSWVGPIELCRPSYRRGRNPDARGRCLGFRCVGDVPT
ncbi:Serine/threonine-protein kinase pkn1 [Rubripirellula lacrimiformis]|uniref:Serine/threonine-protein kinase pkn1 n=1 Tax=Rubripirellula lacrimiformis TaxID=1930273 RepID=A0A517NDA0_9BACT|nr:SUMF1/EgtB/PvdO family nonheme iron enzyme [Rubripirellula lacrimiformis]QDT05086.1 Serine/threonine-protein kinase pkn1 [Rubripirellula lacrimiformis]